MSEPTQTVPTSIDRLNAFMERGWMAALSPIELQVWLCYHKHADAAGVSWPGTGLVAAFVGHDADAHVRAARKRLEGHGLLVKQPASRLPGGALKSPYRVVVPAAPAGSKADQVVSAIASKRSKVERLDDGGAADRGPAGDTNRSESVRLHDDQSFRIGTPEEADRSEMERPDPPTVPLSARNRSTSDRATVPLRNTKQTIEQTSEQEIQTTPPGGGVKPPGRRRREWRPGDREVRAIYDAYPKKVGRGYAVKAICVALRNLELDSPAAEDGEAWESWLLGKTKAYAAARARKLAADPTDGPSWTPHPASWFNGGYYHDDPAEWERIKKGSQHDQPYASAADKRHARSAANEFANAAPVAFRTAGGARGAH